LKVCGLVAQELFETLAGFILTRLFLGRRHELAADHIEVLAIVCHVLFGNGISAAVSALVGDFGIVADAIEADSQVRTAGVAGFRATRTAG
jgi:hypothetical protein